MYTTYKFKIYSNHNTLQILASKVNFVWNYCNETSFKAIKNNHKWLDRFDIINLIARTSKTLNINAHSLQMVGETYVRCRQQSHKRKLKWRTKKSLGWIPFKNNGIKVIDNKVKYYGTTFKFHKSREIQGEICTGAFVQDSKRDWYICLTCKVEALPKAPIEEPVGIDLGLKSIAATSDGEIFENPKVYYQYEKQLADAQRRKNLKKVRKISRKIKNVRNDNLHKISHSLASTYQTIFVGDLKLGAGKSVNDAGYRRLITQLEYKASRRQGQVIRVNERYSTVICSQCLSRTGPTGLAGLGVREWTCESCGRTHSRDINAATNILRFGCEMLKTLEESMMMPGEGTLRNNLENQGVAK